MVEQDDISLDQSTRVRDRVANGVYRIVHGNKLVGEELWQLLVFRNGANRVMTEIAMQWPIPHQHRVRYDLDEDWTPRALWIEVEMPSGGRHLRYNGSFTHEPGAPLTAHVSKTVVSRDDAARESGAKADKSAPQPDEFQSFRGAPSKLILNEALPFAPGAQLDFNSPLFNYTILKRLGLEHDLTGQLSFDSVAVTLPQLQPIRARQTYALLDTKPPLGKQYDFAVRHFRITEPDNASAATDFWVNERDIVVRQDVVLDGLPHVTELSSYRWQAR